MLYNEDYASLCAFELEYRKAHIKSRFFLKSQWKWFSLQMIIKWNFRGKCHHVQLSQQNFHELCESRKLRISFQWSLCACSTTPSSEVSFAQCIELAGRKFYKLNISNPAVLPQTVLLNLKKFWGKDEKQFVLILLF